MYTNSYKLARSGGTGEEVSQHLRGGNSKNVHFELPTATVLWTWSLNLRGTISPEMPKKVFRVRNLHFE